MLVACGLVGEDDETEVMEASERRLTAADNTGILLLLCVMSSDYVVVVDAYTVNVGYWLYAVAAGDAVVSVMKQAAEAVQRTAALVIDLVTATTAAAAAAIAVAVVVPVHCLVISINVLTQTDGQPITAVYVMVCLSIISSHCNAISFLYF